MQTKRLITAILATAILCIFTSFLYISVKANDYNDNNQTLSDYKNKLQAALDGYNGKGGKIHIDDGVVPSRQGAVFYMINDAGNVITTPKYYAENKDFKNVKYFLLNTRIGNITPVEYTGDMPYIKEMSKSYTDTYKTKSLDHLRTFWGNAELAMSPHADEIIKELWGEEALATWRSTTNSVYFIVEPFYWNGIYVTEKVRVADAGKYAEDLPETIVRTTKSYEDYLADFLYPYTSLEDYVRTEFSVSESYLQSLVMQFDSELRYQYKLWVETVIQTLGYKVDGNGYTTIYKYTNERICATVYNMALFEQSGGSLAGTGNYWRNYYPNFIRFDKDIPLTNGQVLFSYNKTGELSVTERLTKMVGIEAHWNKASGDYYLGNYEPKDDKTSYKLTSLFATKNYSNEFEVSDAIPSGEEVVNEVIASTFYGEDGTVNEVTTTFASKTYTVRYKWTEVLNYTVKEPKTTTSNIKINGDHGSLELQIVTYGDDSRSDIDRLNSYTGLSLAADSNGYYYGNNRYYCISGRYSADETNKGGNPSFACKTEVKMVDKACTISKDHYYEGYTYTVTPSVSYYMMTKVPNIYALDKIEVLNGAFPTAETGSTGITYQRSDLTIKKSTTLRILIYNKEGNAAFNYNSANISLSSAEALQKAVNTNTKETHYKIEGKKLSELSIPTTISLGTVSRNVTKEQAEAVTEDKPYAAGPTVNEQLFVSAVKDELDKNGGYYSRNDTLWVTDNGKDFVISGSTEVTKYGWVKGCDFTVTKENGSVVGGSSGSTAYAVNGYGKGNNKTLSDVMKSLEMGAATGKKTVIIPVDRVNGDYATNMAVTYKNIVNGANKILGAGLIDKSAGIVDGMYDNHVMEGGMGKFHDADCNTKDGHRYGDLYPIRVHTPVVSPLEIKMYDESGNIVDAIEKTQLVVRNNEEKSAFNKNADYQLKLDRYYFVKWDDTLWQKAVYDTPDEYETPEGYENIFNKYVKSKEIRFPFTVVYENTLYKVGADGYTEWITVKAPTHYLYAWNTGVGSGEYKSSNHWEMTPFYIPSFSEEVGAYNENAQIEVRVEAKNTSDRFRDEADTRTKLTMNYEKESYFATANKTVQVSGWLYDFTIVGVQNRSMMTGELYENGSFDYVNLKAQNLPLSPDYKEVKSGTSNRIGSNILRYLKDGGVYNGNNMKTLPFRNGYSEKYTLMGASFRGQVTAFTIKTISNAYHDSDTIEIIPTYTYITEDGRVLTEDKFAFIYAPYGIKGPEYYQYKPYDKYKTSSWTVEEYMKAGTFSLSNTLFKESFYDKQTVINRLGDWVNRTMNYYNKTHTLEYPYDYTQFMKREVTTSSIQHITIPSEMRLLSAEYEQLERNLSKDGKEAEKYNFNGYTQTEESTLFAKSMQQWHTALKIPNTIRFIDLDKLEEKGRKEGNPGKYFKTYIVNEDGSVTREFDFTDYTKKVNAEGYLWYWEYCDKEDIPGTGFIEDMFMEKNSGKLIVNFEIYLSRDGKPYLQYDGGSLSMWEAEGYKTGIKDDTGLYEYVKGDVFEVDLSKGFTDFQTPGLLWIN